MRWFAFAHGRRPHSCGVVPPWKDSLWFPYKPIKGKQRSLNIQLCLRFPLGGGGKWGHRTRGLIQGFKMSYHPKVVVNRVNPAVAGSSQKGSSCRTGVRQRYASADQNRIDQSSLFSAMSFWRTPKIAFHVTLQGRTPCNMPRGTPAARGSHRQQDWPRAEEFGVVLPRNPSLCPFSACSNVTAFR